MMRAQTWVRALAVLALTAGAVTAALAQAPEQPGDSVLVRAMRDELSRTMAQLQLEKADRPYFVAYTVIERDGAYASAGYGSLTSSGHGRSRILVTDVRIGDYTLDNTNAARSFGFGMRSFFGAADLPLDDDYLEIRRQIWLATDAAYKQAVESMAAKRAGLLNRTRTDSLPDFTKGEVTHTWDEFRPAPFDQARSEALVRDLSRAGVSPTIYTSSVSVGASFTRAFYLNSEGTTFVRSRPITALTATASTQAADGMPLGISLTVSARSMDGLPTRDLLAALIRAMYARLDTARAASGIERYNGPVLFEGRAAAELFSGQFAPALAASRSSQRSSGSLSEKLGARVLPEFLSVLDDPTLPEAGSVPMLGGYQVDDQGVRAHPTRVVENGILKAFLSSRVPVDGAPTSSGNYRDGGIAPSNLLVVAAKGESASALRARLLEQVKARGLPYGIIVRALGGGGGSDDPSMGMMGAMSRGGGGNLLLAYKVFADGHEEAVRGAQLIGVNVEAFKGIIAASDSATVLNAFASGDLSAVAAAAGTGSSITSYSVPSLLFDDLTVTKRTDDLPKPPMSTPPVAPK